MSDSEVLMKNFMPGRGECVSSVTKILWGTIVLAALSATSYAMANDEAPETEVVVRGMKRIKPTDAPPSLELYAKPPHFEQIALSPDGTRVAFMSRVGEMRILAGYRFADRKHVYYKVVGANVSAINWADDTHVMISDSRLATRGTCEVGGANTNHQQLNARDLPKAPAASASENSALQSEAQRLLDANQPPRCAYFGVRGENALTSVNMLTGEGKPIGAFIGDAPSRALGFPTRINAGGKSLLVGPFLEMRAQSSGSQPAQRVFLWNVDLETGHGRLVDDGGGDIERENRYVDDWLLDGAGTVVARTLYDYRSDTYRIEMKTDGRWKPILSRQIIRADNTFAPFLAGIASNGTSVVILDTATHGKDPKGSQRRFHYYELDTNGMFSGPLENGDAGQVRPVFDPRSGRLAGFASQEDEPKYDIREPGLREVYDKALAATPGRTTEVLSVSDDMQKVLIRVSSDEETGAYYLLDFSTGSSTTLGEDFPLIPTSWIAGQELVSYTAQDGTSLTGVLTVPPKPTHKNLPLIVLPHDGPDGQDSLGFNWLTQALASRGYLVFQPNYRGSDGRGADFVSAGYGQWEGKILSDIDDGVETLTQQGRADPRRVCVIGVGFGGYAALKAVETAKVRCGVSIDGISDTERYLAWRKTSAPSPDPDAFASLSPSPKWPRTFLKEPTSARSLGMFIGSGAAPISPSAILAPVLLIHQDGDGIVPVSQSRTLHDQLQAAGKQVDYLELKGHDHTPDTEEARLRILQTVTAFLDAHNPAEK